MSTVMGQIENNTPLETEAEDFRVKTDLRIPNIAAYADIRVRLQEIVDRQKYQERLAAMGASLPRGIMFYGGEGAGKTYMAEAFAGSLAEETGRQIFRFSGLLYMRHDLNRLGDLEDVLLENEASILILEDLDRMTEDCSTEDSALFRVFGESISESDVYVIATARNAGIVSEDIRKIFSLKDVVWIYPPTAEDTEAMLADICTASGFPWNFRSETERMKRDREEGQMSDVAAMCWKDRYGTLREYVNCALVHAVTGGKESMDLGDMLYALQRCNYKYDSESLKPSPDSIRKRAVHEAGHVLAAERLQPGIAGIATIVLEGDTEGHDGFTCYAGKWKRKDHSVITALAGKAATDLVLGEEASDGCVSDIQDVIERIENSMLHRGRYGMDYVELHGDYKTESPETRKKQEERIYAEACLYYEKARKILREHRDILDRLTEKLMKDGYLLASEIRDFCHPKEI